jgi:hypothetical protein
MIPPPPPKPDEPGVFEDLIDIFTSPAKVFARRAKGGSAAAYFIVAIALAVLGYTARPVMDPIMDVQMQKGMQAAMKANPNMNADQMAQGLAFQRKLYPVYYVAIPPLAIFFLGIFVWVIGKVFGAAVTVGSSIMIATFAYVPRLLGSVITDVQALMAKDTSTFVNMSQLSVGPARFMDPNATGAVLLSALTRVDLLVIWTTVLIGVGYAAAGKLSKGRAAAAATTCWVLGSLWIIWGASRAG